MNYGQSHIWNQTETFTCSNIYERARIHAHMHGQLMSRMTAESMFAATEPAGVGRAIALTGTFSRLYVAEEPQQYTSASADADEQQTSGVHQWLS